MFKGIRVIDFTQYLPGPYASLRLIDRGAEVIKVEPLTGDPARVFGQAVFSANNRNKKSIAINLKSDGGRKLAMDLIRHADVVLESFRPGVMKKLGLDYETCKKVNEKIIYVSISGFGQSGAWAQLASHDLNYLGLSGVLGQFRNEDGSPVHPSLQLADLIGGIVASEAVAGALYQREKSGCGAFVDLSLMDAVFSLLPTHVMNASLTGNSRGISELAGNIVNYHIYETKDGCHMTLSALEQKFWKNFCQAVERPEWIAAYPDRLSVHLPIYEEMKALFRSRTQAEWIQLGLEADACLFPVLGVQEAARSSYVRERGLVKEVEQKPFVSTFAAAELTPEVVSKIGEHTDDVLRSVLGLSDDDILALRNKGTIV